jgi:hypothetical protein
MSLATYTLMRNVPAETEDGKPTLIAIALVTHANGTLQRVAIPEELIRYAGEGIIEHEVRQAAMLPPDGSILPIQQSERHF